MATYYTLDEAARILQTSPEEVRKMAEEKKLRTFRDKGTLRFRAQEIDELARQLGLGSDADLQLGEVPQPKKGSSPVPGKKVSKVDSPPPARRPSKVDSPAPAKRVSKVDSPPPAKQPSKMDSAAPPKRASKIEKPPDAGEVFDFSLSLDEEEEQVQLGSLPPPGPSSSRTSSSKKKPGPPSPSPKVPPASPSPKTAPTPPPKPGSDSDIRLVSESEEVDFNLPVQEGAPPSPSPGTRKKSSMRKKDSGVRIVPLEPSDSDVKMVLPHDDAVVLGGESKSASDSDIRMEQPPNLKGDGSDPAMVTEEIDLDEEMQKLAPQTPPPKPRSSTPQLPTSSPFELSEEDLTVEEPEPSTPSTTDSSGDFELTPALEDSSPLELGSDEIPALQMEDDEEVSLGELSESAGGSGINLKDPADSGISLEQEGESSEDIDFDLSLDAGGTPAPAAKAKGKKGEEEEDSSEFELSLDDSDEAATPGSTTESSEFELSLDEDSGSSELEVDLEPVAETGEDSDSEFELTLDDSGGSSPLEDVGEEKDIFETDFEVPALEEESGSEALALDEDTDLESEDLELAIDEMDVESDDESKSQVVALEDEEDLEEVSQPKRKTKTLAADEDEESPFGDIAPVLGEEEEEEEELVAAGGKARVEYVEKETAPWGPVPAILMVPCVIVLFVVGLMSFELIQGMSSYQKTGKITGIVLPPIVKMITGEEAPGAAPKK
jgi:excisionase family DNA binding protein